MKTEWKKFRELLPVLTFCHLSYQTHGHVYSSCMQSAMLHASETWPMTKTNLQRNDRAILRQICSNKPEDVANVRSSDKCGSRGGDRGSGPPLENHKLYGFLKGISNWTPPPPPPWKKLDPPPWKMLDPLWNLEK